MTFSGFLNRLADTDLNVWIDSLTPTLIENWDNTNDGNLPKFLKALNNLPDIKTKHIKLSENIIEIGHPDEICNSQREQLLESLKALMPWRKGPFKLFGILIDSEWQSWMKWNRIEPHLSDLTNRLILDVGSGNGYYMLKMLNANAKITAGVDPSLLSTCQFLAIQKYLNAPNAAVMPLTMENVKPNLETFDTVFSMGVLYHRKSPFDHIAELKSALRPGGELVIETLVIHGDENSVLVPVNRYSVMNNIYFLPSSKALKNWIMKAGFEDVKIVDESYTTIKEQRATEWKLGTSLSDYLDPNDPKLTVEGHPAPLRATIIAKKPYGQTKLPRYKLS